MSSMTASKRKVSRSKLQADKKLQQEKEQAERAVEQQAEGRKTRRKYTEVNCRLIRSCEQEEEEQEE
jgi:hypothetical protein